MDFRKKLKTRLYSAFIFIIFGILMIIFGNNMASSIGFAFTVIGIVRVRNYFIITKNEDTIRKQEILESDERNIMIMHRARSITLSISIMIGCLAEIVLSILNYTELSHWIGYSLCLTLVIYFIVYLIVKKNN